MAKREASIMSIKETEIYVTKFGMKGKLLDANIVYIRGKMGLDHTVSTEGEKDVAIVSIIGK
jgi:hypothetical protein